MRGAAREAAGTWREARGVLDELRRAIARDELSLAYQPIVMTGSGDIVGVEALLRWQHPERGAIRPDLFVPIAEQGGLMIPLGNWMLREVFAEYGLSEALQHQIADEMAKDKHKWVDFMMRFELGLEKPQAYRATQSALTIGGAYIVGGIIPLSPYFFISNSQTALFYSCGITLLCLFVFGYFKSKVTGQAPLAGAFKVVIIGALAAAAAFLVAKQIDGK